MQEKNALRLRPTRRVVLSLGPAFPNGRPPMPGRESMTQEKKRPPTRKVGPLDASKLRERLRTFAVVLAHAFALLVVAMVPGSRLRPLTVELTAPPLPPEVSDRPASLEVSLFRKAADGNRGEAVADARVRAFTILEGKAYSAADVQTKDGHASLTKLPPGEHWIVAEAPGLARASRMVMLVNGARSLDLLMVPARALDVTVTNEAGDGVPNATIEVQASDPFPVAARTDDHGHAIVTRLADGPYAVTVSAFGFDTAEVRQATHEAKVHVVMKKLAALRVSVLGPDGAKVAHARVEITSAVLWPSRSAETDAGGQVRIGSLPEGTYSLRATSGSLASTTELAVSVARGEEKDVTLKLAQGVSVAIRVLDGDSDRDAWSPLAGARVVLAEGGLSAFPVEGVTAKNGVVVLGPIPRGGASVMASHEGYVSATVVVTDGPVDVVLERAGTIVGKVLDGRGFAVDGARIEIVGTDLHGMPVADDPRRTRFRAQGFDVALGGPRPLVPAGELGVMPGTLPDTPHGIGGGARTTGLGPGEGWITERDGRFRASPVTPGRVRAIVRHPQYVEASSDFVDLVPGGSAELTITMRAGGLLEGRVVDSHDRPVEGAEIVAMATRGTLERMTRTDRYGAFAFASLPEDVTIVVERPRTASGGVSVARVEAKVPEGGRASMKVVLPDPRDDLPVRVLDARGDGIDGAQVTVGSLDPGAPLRATVFTDKRGEARVPGAKGLALHVEVLAPHAATKALELPDSATELRVELLPSEDVEGEVRTYRRDAISDAFVTLYCEDGAHHARTNKEGDFILKGAPSGACRLAVRAPGFAPKRLDLTVTASRGRRATTVPRVTLDEEAVVEGTVVDGKGQPVPLARVAKDTVPVVLVAGAPPPGVAETDARGRFRLGELPQGIVSLEAYAPGRGQGRVEVRLYVGRTQKDVKVVLGEKSKSNDPDAKGAGGVAVTLGEASGPNPEVGVVSVVAGSAAERAGLEPGDILLEVSGVAVHTIAEARTRLTGPLADDVVVKLRRGARVESRRIPREEVRK